MKKVFLIIAGFILIASVSCKNETAKFSANAVNSNIKPGFSESDRRKIVAFGDSLTAGFGLLENESYPYLLQEKLKADGYDYEVLNAGVSGDTSAGGLERIDWSLDQKNVQILILELGANDLLRGLPPAQMKQNLDKMIRRAKAKNIQVLLCGMLSPRSMGSDYQADYINAFHELAQEHKIEFLQFILKDVALNVKLNQADGIHPNAAGEVIMTENIYKALKPLLKK
jgi:acyl-CoA thioesterase-1